MIELSVIVVNFNGGEDTLRCLRALERVSGEVESEIIVIDNGSSDGSCERIEHDFTAVQLIRAGANLGFAAACNRGLERAAGRHALLLNPDTEVCAGALSGMVRALDEHPGWGIVGARMVDGSGKLYTAARRFPRPFDLFCEQLHLANWFPRSRWFARYFYGEHAPETLDAVEQVEGSALMISGAARQQVGDLDPQFFVFFEEVDWCRRVKAAGLEIHVVQSARIVHHRATTMSRFFVQSRSYHARSAQAYFRKHYGERGLRSLRRWMIAAGWIREIGARVLLPFAGGDTMRLRIAGARAERKIYREPAEGNR
ncbi:glycosyltransferase family 2 protein [candidate division KSB1 bacterium]|nr:glycosyltransferase family 2 protein [candidate division KSB1 bacterium]